MATAQAESGAPAGSRQGPVGVIFLTIFLDLVGFSIIFPLFPAMLRFYFDEAAAGGLLAQFLAAARALAPGADETHVAVLFGGLLGSLYSALQFFSAPFWGRLSDRIGRRPVLLLTVAGTALSYLLWIFAGQFWLLVVARGLGGVMSGNLSVCTAAIADVTAPEQRARGMAVVGVAFALGFIIGPAFGGMFAGVDLAANHPASVRFGINPFSACALAAFALSVINYFQILAQFPETLTVAHRDAAARAAAAAAAAGRPGGLARVLAIFRPAQREIRRANLVNLFYTLAFSGLEFTLTFLAAERFQFKPLQLAGMFVFMGLVLIVVRGWLGRKHVARWGERNVVRWALGAGMAGFALLAAADNVPLFYAGMGVFCVSVGLISVCLPALVSRYSDGLTQGRNLGAYNSAGALARAVGPLVCAAAYFALGPATAYGLFAVALLVPLALAWGLPEPAAPALPAN